MKRICLRGPMTGLPSLNFPAFAATTTSLRARGHAVTNPAEINPAGDSGTNARAASRLPWGYKTELDDKEGSCNQVYLWAAPT
ncbi:DUF4406 domain-containing protein [Pseudomonas sp. GL-R-19]|uniref:DUF4406 domain-containing protein n=1 Tax=Pseudomonas sp. GL-R-19 TaxID=2832391 RepID=UPI001CBB5F24|nr:DUF4406 domain-containing protein [Pseudomonas sp. GL-R-19]